MLAAGSPERPATKAPGLVSQAVLRLLMRRARVTAVEDLADRFRLITLEGPALEGVAWTAGQKVQVAMGSAFVTRTYTPLAWNAATGRTCILGFAHGAGPGSAWVRGLARGDECDLFGPRASLDLRRAAGPVAVFGDETSIGLAHALAHREQGRPVACYLEVEDVAAARLVLRKLELCAAELFAKADGDAAEAMAASIPALLAAGACFVLTGQAATIQHLRQALKRHGVPGTSVLTKAYWAPGKTGMD